MRRAPSTPGLGLAVLALVACGAPAPPGRPPSTPSPPPPASPSLPPPPPPMTSPHTLAAGNDRSCAIQSGAVYCWGQDAETPALVEGLGRAISIAVHDDDVCAIDDAGLLRCTIRPLVRGARSAEVESFERLGRVRDVALTEDLACALGEDGGVSCWGDNAHGELAVEAPGRSYLPVSAPFTARALAVGRGRACRLDDAGATSCWGEGFGDEARHVTPVPFADDAPDARLAVGGDFGCAARLDGPLRCWGAPPRLRPAPFTQPAPDTVACAIDGVRALAAEGDHVCALLTDGRVRCLAPEADVRGDATPATRCEDTGPVRDLEDAVEIAVGREHGCARRADGSVVCWGEQTGGRLGSCGARLRPRRVEGLSGIREVGVTQGWGCALAEDGALTCFSASHVGEPLETGITRFRVGSRDVCFEHGDAIECAGDLIGPDPVPLVGASAPRDFAVLYETVLTLDATGAVRCFGCTVGQDGAEARLSHPRVIGRVPDGVQIDGVLGVYCVRTSAGEVYCGHAARDERPPRRVRGIQGARSIAVGGGADGALALLDDGRVVRWQPADPASAVEAISIEGTPVQLFGGSNACVMLDDGALHCWGRTIGAHLGAAEDRLTRPTRVEDLAHPTSLAMRFTMGCAVVDGEVLCWGPGTGTETAYGHVLHEVCFPAP